MRFMKDVFGKLGIQRVRDSGHGGRMNFMDLVLLLLATSPSDDSKNLLGVLNLFFCLGLLYEIFQINLQNTRKFLKVQWNKRDQNF